MHFSFVDKGEEEKNHLLILKKAAELILQTTGQDFNQGNLAGTPERFSKAMTEILAGHHESLQEILSSGIFPSESSGLVCVKDVEFYSLCEHHLLPFWGNMSVAYIPENQILGISKIGQIIDHFAKRLQIQERLTEQVTHAINDAIKPRAVIVRAQAQHFCMMMRGLKKQGSVIVTEALRNPFPILPTELEHLRKILQ